MSHASTRSCRSAVPFSAADCRRTENPIVPCSVCVLQLAVYPSRCSVLRVWKQGFAAMATNKESRTCRRWEVGSSAPTWVRGFKVWGSHSGFSHETSRSRGFWTVFEKKSRGFSGFLYNNRCPSCRCLSFLFSLFPVFGLVMAHFDHDRPRVSALRGCLGSRRR